MLEERCSFSGCKGERPLNVSSIGEHYGNVLLILFNFQPTQLRQYPQYVTVSSTTDLTLIGSLWRVVGHALCVKSYKRVTLFRGQSKCCCSKRSLLAHLFRSFLVRFALDSTGCMYPCAHADTADRCRGFQRVYIGPQIHELPAIISNRTYIFDRHLRSLCSPMIKCTYACNSVQTIGASNKFLRLLSFF